MSEYSESYHLESRHQQEGVDLLNRAGRAGFVFPSANGWVSLAVDTPAQFSTDLALVSATESTLVHYIYPEDHGWGWRLFRGGRGIGRFLATWDPGDLTVDENDVPFDVLVDLAEGHGSDRVEAEAIFRRVHGLASVDEMFEPAPWSPAYEFARALRLPDVEWISFGMVRDHDELRRPGTVVVPPS